MNTTVDAIEIAWPSGMTTKIDKIHADRIIAIKEGVGTVERAFPRITSK
jgi:hypothetical protein